MRGAWGGLALMALGSCSPATTRPSFRPLPQATVFMLVGEPDEITREAAAWIADAGVTATQVTERDSYIETAWYTPPADSAVPPFAFRVKTRLWADPAGRGRTLVQIETVYQPLEDPSRRPRDLEVAAPPAGAVLSERLAAALRGRFQVV